MLLRLVYESAPRDILEQLPLATKAYRDDYFGVTANSYGAIEVI
jgi:hypothetical protein